jgi:hypothetical protein
VPAALGTVTVLWQAVLDPPGRQRPQRSADGPRAATVVIFTALRMERQPQRLMLVAHTGRQKGAYLETISSSNTYAHVTTAKKNEARAPRSRPRVMLVGSVRQVLGCL